LPPLLKTITFVFLGMVFDKTDVMYSKARMLVNIFPKKCHVLRNAKVIRKTIFATLLLLTPGKFL
jgi:hypothetical protein